MNNWRSVHPRNASASRRSDPRVPSAAALPRPSPGPPPAGGSRWSGSPSVVVAPLALVGKVGRIFIFRDGIDYLYLRAICGTGKLFGNE